MADEIDTEFELVVNLAGVEPSDLFVEMPAEGVYKCKSSNVGTKENGNLQVETELQESKWQGMSLRITVGTDEKAGNRRNLTAALLSHGHKKETFAKGEIKLTKKAFIGRECFVYYKPKAEGEQYDTRKFISKERYEQMRAKDKLNEAATASEDFAVETKPVTAAGGKAKKNGVAQPAVAATAEVMDTL